MRAGVIGTHISIKFIVVYISLQCSAVLIIWLTGANSVTNIIPGLRVSQSLFMFMILLILGGMPPSPLFFAKLDLLLTLSDLNIIYLSVGLLLSSRVRFYGYININIFKACLGARSLYISPSSSIHYSVIFTLLVRYGLMTL